MLWRRGGTLSLPFPGFGRRFSRFFVLRQANVSHRAVITRKEHTVAFKFGVFELAPHVQLVLETGLAFLFGAEPGRGQPAIGRHSLGSCPEGP